jgi:hypothetical protein
MWNERSISAFNEEKNTGEYSPVVSLLGVTAPFVDSKPEAHLA